MHSVGFYKLVGPSTRYKVGKTRQVAAAMGVSLKTLNR